MVSREIPGEWKGGRAWEKYVIRPFRNPNFSLTLWGAKGRSSGPDRANAQIEEKIGRPSLLTFRSLCLVCLHIFLSSALQGIRSVFGVKEVVPPAEAA